MLNIMRKKAGSWIIKVILFAIVVVFVFWGVGSYQSRKDNQLADVNGTIVTYDAYRQAYQNLLEQYRRVYGAQLNDDMLKLLRLDEAALDQIIYRVLMLQEAERLGLKATEPEIADSIHQVPAFQKDGVFNFEQYRTLLTQNNLTTEEFEKNQGESILMNHLRALITEGISVPVADARQWYEWQNAQINLSYLLFSADRYKDISPTQDEISAYYNEHKNNYLTEPQVKVRYLLFDPKAFEQNIEISGEDIERYYYGNPNEFVSEKTVQARHILLKLDADADEQTIENQRKKAMEVYELAKKGQAFDELAKKYSEGPTRDTGGDLGTFSKDTMVKPFADRAFSMEAGEISEPVRTQFGWHIIKVEQVNPATTQSLNGAKNEITARLKARKARELAMSKAESIYDSVFDGDDLSALEPSDQMVMGTTDFFSAQQTPDIGGDNAREFAEAALALQKMAISEILELNNGFYMLQVIDRKEPAVPALEEIAERVKSDVISVKQQEQAKTDAQAVLSELKTGQALAELAAAKELKVRETGFFKRNAPVPDLGYNPEINRLGFSLSEQEPLAQEVAQSNQGWLVLRLKERKAPDQAGFEKESEDIIAQLTEQKKQETFQNWLNDLKERGKIEINRELLR